MGWYRLSSCCRFRQIFLSISGAKGKLDSTTIHQFKMYEITEQLNAALDTIRTEIPNAGMKIGNLSLPVIPKDTIQAINICFPPSIWRISV